MPKSFHINNPVENPRYAEVELETGEKVRIFPAMSTFCVEHLHVTLERCAGSAQASREEHEIFIRDLIVILLESGEKTADSKHRDH
jgi:hypothetical protein